MNDDASSTEIADLDEKCNQTYNRPFSANDTVCIPPITI
jgi:hypothetical protein